MSKPLLTEAAWAAHGKWLTEKLSEHSIGDGRCILQLVDEPIWIRADQPFSEYIAAVDLAMERDESRVDGVAP